jgi:hypothetical protein
MHDEPTSRKGLVYAVLFDILFAGNGSASASAEIGEDVGMGV